jgi:antitoxin component of MazEF toxin-antitoxin module
MVTKLFKVGDNLAIALPDDLLARLALQEGAEVSLEFDQQQRQIIIAPQTDTIPPATVDAVFAQQLADFIEQYRPALEALA